jgi:hypothetical protein
MDIITCPYCRAVQPPLTDKRAIVANCVQCGHEFSANQRGLNCDYVWLAIGGWLFAILAVATLAAAIAVFPFIHPLWILWGLLSGLCQLIIAAALFAIRTTAQNTWAIRQHLSEVKKLIAEQ